MRIERVRVAGDFLFAADFKRAGRAIPGLSDRMAGDWIYGWYWIGGYCCTYGQMWVVEGKSQLASLTTNIHNAVLKRTAKKFRAIQRGVYVD